MRAGSESIALVQKMKSRGVERTTDVKPATPILMIELSEGR
jgi:hypothetical protein